MPCWLPSATKSVSSHWQFRSASSLQPAARGGLLPAQAHGQLRTPCPLEVQGSLMAATFVSLRVSSLSLSLSFFFLAMPPACRTARPGAAPWPQAG